MYRYQKSLIASLIASLEMDFLGKILFSKSMNTLQLQTADSAEFIVNANAMLVKLKICIVKEISVDLK